MAGHSSSWIFTEAEHLCSGQGTQSLDVATVCWNRGMSREEAGNSALENLLLLWPSSSTLAAYTGNFPAFWSRRKDATVTFCLMRWESCSHVRNSISKRAQVQALTSLVGLTRMAVLPASSTACQQKSTAGMLARWSLTLTLLHSYGVKQHFASSLLLCSPDCITSQIKGDKPLSMTYFPEGGRPTAWAQVRGSWSINSLYTCILLQHFPSVKQGGCWLGIKYLLQPM